MASVQTKDYIVQLIKEEILSGVMKPGEELAQEALAERLGVSRMPIREALQNLVQEGFAVRLPNRHIQAVVLSVQQIHDVFHVIAAMAAENTILVAKKEQMSLIQQHRAVAEGHVSGFVSVKCHGSHPHFLHCFFQLAGLEGFVLHFLPQLGVPDLGPVKDADDDHFFFQVGVLAQLGGQENAALGIGHAVGHVGVHHAQTLDLGKARALETGVEVGPALVGENGQAVVLAHGDVEGAAQLVPELGGDEQPALGINIVRILAVHVRIPSLRHHIVGKSWDGATPVWVLAPLSPTSESKKRHRQICIFII